MTEYNNVTAVACQRREAQWSCHLYIDEPDSPFKANVESVVVDEVTPSADLDVERTNRRIDLEMPRGGNCRTLHGEEGIELDCSQSIEE